MLAMSAYSKLTGKDKVTGKSPLDDLVGGAKDIFWSCKRSKQCSSGLFLGADYGRFGKSKYDFCSVLYEFHARAICKSA